MMFNLLVVFFTSSVIFALVSSSPVLVSQKDNLDKEDSLTGNYFEVIKIHFLISFYLFFFLLLFKY
jgi:hypothetical protein